MATKAGSFEAYHFEIYCRRFAGPESDQGLSHNGIHGPGQLKAFLVSIAWNDNDRNSRN
jgi:hypothetical protein